jgi:hypothetical protein
MKRSLLITATLITIFGCSPKAGTTTREENPLTVDWWCARGKIDCRILCEIKTLPKSAFLKSVAVTTALSSEDKLTISNAISQDVYTHAYVQKAEYRGTQFLVIDQFYPKQIVGKDNEGHEIVEGGSGSLGLIVIGNTNGFQSSMVHYD